MKYTTLAACHLQIDDISSPSEKQYLINIPYQDKSLNDFQNTISLPSYLNVYLEDLYLYGKIESMTKNERSKPERILEFSEKDLDYNSLSELLSQLYRFVSTSKNHEILSTVGAEARQKIVFSNSKINHRLNNTIIYFLKQEILMIYKKYSSESDRKPTMDELDQVEIVNHLINIQKDRQTEMMGKRKSLTPKDVSLGYFHLIMHKIALLCKFEKRNLNRSNTPIEEISLSTVEYKFIYDYLEYFDLLEYDKPLYTTTQPERYIRTMYSKFPKSTHPDLWEEIGEILNKITNLDRIKNYGKYL